jgi:superfamily II DNA or RNA helicase
MQRPPPPVAPQATRCFFKLKPESKFRNPSEPQAQALEAIRGTSDSGIVILPCGAGKTAVFLQAALEAGNRVLFLNFEKQGVMQVADAIREHTNVSPTQLCAYSSECKTQPNTLLCYMVTTYSMFSTTSNRSGDTARVRQFVTTTPWDLVVLDECHHAAAETYMPLIKILVQNSRRVLGFTGTLCRGVAMAGADEQLRNETNAKEFAFIGRVLYSRTPAELEAAGLIAKVRRTEVSVRMTPHFEAAHERVSGSLKQYLQALNPDKLNAVWMLVNLHRSMQHVGMIFCNHLLPAKALQGFLGERWGLLSGGNAYGTEGTHTAQINAALVKRFNSGELDGLIATPVGESALDVFNPHFRYAIVIDAHGGQAPASQKLGRLSRTPRVLCRPDETPEAHRKHLLGQQKDAIYYEIVTEHTEEETAAKARDVQFVHDGYEATRITFGTVQDAIREAGFEEADAPFASPVAQIKLLVECLSYPDLGQVECIGNAMAGEALRPHREAVKSGVRKVATAKHSIFKKRAQDNLDRTRAQLPKRKAEAAAAKREVLQNAPIPEVAVRILRELMVDADLLASADIELPPPNPEEVLDD